MFSNDEVFARPTRLILVTPHVSASSLHGILANLGRTTRCFLWLGLVLSSLVAARADTVAEAWTRRYDGPVAGTDYPIGVGTDTVGSVAVVGRSNGNGTAIDFYTANYAAGTGAILWERRYATAGNDVPYAVAFDPSGNVMVTGYTGTVPASNYYTAKYAAADGALLWERTYNGPANATDFAQALAVDSEGNVIVTGFSVNGGAGDFYTAKYAADDGALIWERRYNGPANGADAAEAVAVDSDGNVVVTGSSDNNGSGDYYTAKYAAADGALLWEKRYNGPGNELDAGHAVAVDTAGDVIVTGYSDGGVTGQDIYTAKYAGADGALVWERRYDNKFKFDEAWSIGVDVNGDIFITANSDSDFYTAKYASATGAVLWERRYHNPANSGAQVSSLSVGALGDVFVTGSVRAASGYDDIYTAKYGGTTGAVLWEKIYDGPAHLTDTMHQLRPYTGKIAATPDGGAVVICQSASAPYPGNYDFATIQYSPLDTDGDGIPDDWETVATTDEDTPTTIALRGWFDYGGALGYDILTPPQHGTLAGTAPNLTYTPDPNFNGTDSFTYIVDYAQASAEGSVSVTVNPVEDAPIAAGQSVITDEDTAMTVTLSGSDVDGDPLAFQITSAPTHGTLSGAAPNLTYTPSANYSGPDSFSFKVHDGSMDSAPANVIVNVIPVNDAPVASSQGVTTTEDVAAAIVLGSSDVDSSSLTYAIVSMPAHGTLSGVAPNVTYIPDVNYSGPDSFSFKVNDGLADSAAAIVAITVTPVNDAPVASSQAVSTNEDTPRAIILSGSDVEAGSLSYSVVTGPAHGTLSGTVPNLSYTPNANYIGSDSFSFKVNDGSVDSAPATVAITMAPVNDVPVAVNDMATTVKNTAVNISVLANDSDVDGDALTVTSTTPSAGGSIAIINGGTAIRFTPNFNYVGNVAFTYTIRDGNGGSATANVQVAVTKK